MLLHISLQCCHPLLLAARHTAWELRGAGYEAGWAKERPQLMSLTNPAGCAPDDHARPGVYGAAQLKGLEPSTAGEGIAPGAAEHKQSENEDQIDSSNLTQLGIGAWVP